MNRQNQWPARSRSRLPGPSPSERRPTPIQKLGGTIGIAAVPIGAVAKIEHDSASRREWDQALADFRKADTAMRDYDRDYLTPVSDAYSAVRDQWPIHYDFGSDPIAKAAIDQAGASYDRIQERFDELVSKQGSASFTELPQRRP